MEPVYQYIGDVNDNRLAKGRAIIDYRGKLGFVDENYNKLASPQFEYISDFKNNKATVQKKGEGDVEMVCGEIDINGKFTAFTDITLIEMSNDSTKDFSCCYKKIKTLKNGYIVVERTDQSPIFQYCAVVDNENNVVMPFKYQEIKELENGMYVVCIRDYYDTRYGLLDQNFKEILEPRFSKLNLIQNSYFVVGGDYCSMMNTKGEIILPFVYSDIKSATPGLVWIYKDRLAGLATIDGQVLIEPTYGKVGNFKQGYATVYKGYWYDDEDRDRQSKWGVINIRGEIVLPSIYDSIQIEDNYFIVSTSIEIQQENGYLKRMQVAGRLNRDGELVIKNVDGEYIPASKKYDWQEDYDTEGYSTVYFKGNKGFVDKDSQQIICSDDNGTEFIVPTEYDWGDYSKNGFAVVENNNKKGVITTDCRLIIDNDYDQIDIICDNNITLFMCGVQNDNQMTDDPTFIWSLLNHEGKDILHSQYDVLIHLGYSLFAIRKANGNFSIVNQNGQLTTDWTFDSIAPFGITLSNNHVDKDELQYAIVTSSDNFGIINKNGRVVIPPKYKKLSIEGNNRFMADGVLINSSEQRILIAGDTVITFENDYEKAERLNNGLFLVSKDNLYGCVNQTGEIIIPIIYKSLTVYDNLLVASLYDDADKASKQGVINFFK